MILGIGVDVVDIDRFRTTMTRTPGIVDRVFTDRERSDLAERSDPVPGFAARFAAKEACLKAFGVGLEGAALSDISVVRLDSGAPVLALTGRAEQLVRGPGPSAVANGAEVADGAQHVLHLSMSHSATTAQAFVVWSRQ